MRILFPNTGVPIIMERGASFRILLSYDKTELGTKKFFGALLWRDRADIDKKVTWKNRKKMKDRKNPKEYSKMYKLRLTLEDRLDFNGQKISNPLNSSNPLVQGWLEQFSATNKFKVNLSMDRIRRPIWCLKADIEVAQGDKLIPSLYDLYIYMEEEGVQKLYDLQRNAVSIVSSISDEFDFIHLTDIHFGIGHKTNYVDRFREIIKELNLINPTFILITGDITHTGSKTQFLQLMYALQYLEVPAYIVIGNHDYTGNKKTNFKTFVNPFSNFSFQYGNCHIVGLDSGKHCGINSGSGLSKRQIDWLQRDLHHYRDSAVKIIMLHHPVVDPARIFTEFRVKNRCSLDAYECSGAKIELVCQPQGFLGEITNNIGKFKTLCLKENVNLVLSGHTHLDAVFDANGALPLQQHRHGPLYIQTTTCIDDIGYIWNILLKVAGWDYYLGFRLIQIRDAKIQKYTYTGDMLRYRWEGPHPIDFSSADIGSIRISEPPNGKMPTRNELIQVLDIMYEDDKSALITSKLRQHFGNCRVKFLTNLPNLVGVVCSKEQIIHSSTECFKLKNNNMYLYLVTFDIPEASKAKDNNPSTWQKLYVTLEEAIPV